MKTAQHDFVNFARFVAAKFRQDKCTQMAASLTFDTLLSLVPLLTIALTLFSAFPVFADFSEQIKHFLLSNLLPETGGKMISRYVEQFAESASKLTAFGLAFLAVTAMLMMITIDNAFNTIWRISKPRPLIKRIMVYWAIITLAPLLIGASLSLTSWLIGLSIGYTRQAPMFGVISLKVVPIILTTLAFSLLFRWLPNQFVSARHAAIGGVVAAAAFESMNRGFGIFIANVPTYKLVYGAFAGIPIFLLWIYLSWLTILFGALITASLPRWRHHGLQQLNAANQLYFAIRILQIMQQSLVTGEPQTIGSLSNTLQLSYDETERLMQKLRIANLVRKLAETGWLMSCAPESIKLEVLLELFLLDKKELPKQTGDEAIHRWIKQITLKINQEGEFSLQHVLALK
jgi:membrane protein